MRRRSRREFLERSLGVLAGASALSACTRETATGDAGEGGSPAEGDPVSAPDASSASESASGLPDVIDAHEHLWDLERFRLPWTDGVPELRRNFGPQDYREASAGVPVRRSVYLEVDVAPELQVKEAEHAIEMCRDASNPVAGAVISGRPGAPGFEAYVERFAEATEIKGLRRILHPDDVPPGRCLEPAFVAGVKLLGKHGLSFDICIRPQEIGDAARLCDASPDTAFVLDHCGNPKFQEDLTAWRRDIAELARRENVVCKVSGFLAQATEEWTVEQVAAVVGHVRESFGPERILFGSDWPVVNLTASYERWVDALDQVTREWSKDERQALFSGNAARVYRLPMA